VDSIQIFFTVLKTAGQQNHYRANGKPVQRQYHQLFTGSPNPDVWISISAFDYGDDVKQARAILIALAGSR